MDQKIAWWPKRTPAQAPAGPAVEDSLTQEDAESRMLIGHYLRLAERLLSTTLHRKNNEEDAEAA